MKNTEAVLITPGSLEIMECPMPEPKDEEVLIKVSFVGICGSDVHGFQNGPFIPPRDPKQKIRLGHEFSGTVVKTGRKVTGFREGDKVLCEPGVPCRKCEYCLSGRYNICPQVDFMATQPNYRGALTNYLVHPQDFTYHLPESMDMKEGALVEPAAVGIHRARLAGVKPGKKILILGAGCIGLMTLQACRIMGADKILAADIIPARLEMAKRLGAYEVINGMEENIAVRTRELLGEDGADIVFETAGTKATAAQGIQCVKRGGKIMIVGTIPGETPVDFLKINREVIIQTVFRYANNFPATIEAIASGRLDVRSMVTDEYDYENVQRAFEESLSRKSDIIKAVIKINQ
ncbi:NAD(P)-dependent alcohol dehydrogenase [Lachnospiraceae bacterium 54-53]